MSKKNYLMEAAAEVLSKSISSAPKDGPKKLEAETHDLGGPTPTTLEKDKPNATAGAPTATAPGPAAPVGQMPSPGKLTSVAIGEDKEVDIVVKDKKDDKKDDDKSDDKDDEKSDDKDDDKDDAKMEEEWKQQLKEDVANILASESNLSEEFRTKVATIYEARVIDKVNQISESMEAAFTKNLEESIVELRDQFSTKIDEYLDYVVEQWMKENEVAIEKGLRAELTEEFITGLKSLFAEHYIDVPEEKVDLVEELAGKVADLETQLNEEVNRGIQFKKQLTEAMKNEVLQSVCEGLTDTQVEKIRTLAESVEFTAEGEYKGKLEAIRENFFPSNVKAGDTKVLTETLEPEAEKKPENSNPEMKAYVSALGRTTKQ